MAITIYHQNESHNIPFENIPEKAHAHYLLSLPFVSPRPLCTGIGKCGRCKIEYLDNIPELSPLEHVLLTKEEQKQNIRLACKHLLEDNTSVRISDDLQKNSAKLDLHFTENHKNCISKQTELQAELFVDLGTTSIAYEIRSADNSMGSSTGSTIFAEGKILNPQMIAGTDIMARLYYQHYIEKKSPSLLQTLILDYFRNLCTELKKHGLTVNEISVSANPAMTAILLGESTNGLLQDPYYLENKGNKTYTFNGLPPLYIPPQMSAFIGADACAGLAHILTNKKKLDNFLLADLGTNGEFIYYHQGQVYGASIPLGPALEGVGMRCGGAVHGKGENIILAFSLTPFGINYTCHGNPEFICGSAYLSLINILLSANIIDRQGIFPEFENIVLSPIQKKILKNLKTINGEKRLYLTENLYICPEDIENILKVKAAFSSAVSLFLQRHQIENIFLSGALSSHIPLDILENLGFLPKNSKTRTKILGNSSLLGLTDYHNNPQLVETIEKLNNNAYIIDLTNQDEYNDLYIDTMHF